MKRFLFNHQLCLHLTLRSSIDTYMQKSSSHFFHVTIVTYACALPEPHLFQGSAPFWSRFVLYVIACIGTRFSETLPLNPTQLHRNVALAQSTCEFLSLRKEMLLNTGCLWKLMGLSISPYNYYSQHIVCALCLSNVVICVPHNDLKKAQQVRLCDGFLGGVSLITTLRYKMTLTSSRRASSYTDIDMRRSTRLSVRCQWIYVDNKEIKKVTETR